MPASWTEVVPQVVQDASTRPTRPSCETAPRQLEPPVGTCDQRCVTGDKRKHMEASASEGRMHPAEWPRSPPCRTSPHPETRLVISQALSVDRHTFAAARKRTRRGSGSGRNERESTIRALRNRSSHYSWPAMPDVRTVHRPHKTSDGRERGYTGSRPSLRSTEHKTHATGTDLGARWSQPGDSRDRLEPSKAHARGVSTCVRPG